MFRQAQVTAYDCLDQVHIVIRLQEAPDDTSVLPEWETVCVTRIQSTGEEERREWLRDALIAALERL